jgi:hypothetical protein
MSRSGALPGIVPTGVTFPVAASERNPAVEIERMREPLPSIRSLPSLFARRR